MMDDNPAAGRRVRVWPALRAHVPLVAILAVLGAAAAGVLASLLPVEYVATSSVLVQPLDGNPYSPTAVGSDLVRLETEAQVVSSDEIVAAVRTELPVALAGVDLTRGLSASVVPNTQIIEITYRGTDPSIAEAVSRQFADSYLVYRGRERDIAMTTRKAGIEASLSSVERALRKWRDQGFGPNSPEVRASGAQLQNLRLQLSTLDTSAARSGAVVIAPVARRSGLSLPVGLAVPAGLVAGALLGAVIALMRERHLERLRSSDDIELLSVPVLGHIKPERATHPLQAVRAVPDAALTVAAVLSRRVAEPTAVVAVAPLSGSDPLAFAAQLAAALAEGRQRVLWVDAASTVASALPGLSDAVTGHAEVTDLFTEHGDLSVLTVGTRPEQGARLFGTPRCDRVLQEALTGFDWVVVHGPSAATPAGRALVSGCDTWVPLVALGHDTRHDLERGLQWAATTDTQVFGVVALDQKAGSPPAWDATDEQESSEEPSEDSPSASGAADEAPAPDTDIPTEPADAAEPPDRGADSTAAAVGAAGRVRRRR